MSNPIFTFYNDQTGSKYSIELTEKNNNQIIYSFNEFTKISVSSTYSIEIMVNSYILDKKIINVVDKYLKLKKNTIYQISFTDCNLNCYIPGIYEIKYQNYLYYFKVNNNDNVFDDTRTIMAEEINKLNPNLISDYSTINKYNNLGVFNLNELNDFLINNYGHFYLNFEKSKVIKGTIVKEEVLKKQNNKTIRLNNQKPLTNKFYNVKKVNEYEFDYYLLKIKEELENFNSLIALKYKDELNCVNKNNVVRMNNKYFKTFYLTLNEIINSNYICKSSMVLFEMFSLCLIIDSITKLGFTIYNKNINFEDKLIFIKEQLKIEILYDRVLSKSTSAENLIYSLNSKHNRPDFVLLIFDKDRIIDSIVIDSKYRNIDSLKCDISRILEICYDYYQLVVDDLKRPKRIVSDVLVFYPNLEDTYFEYEVGYFLGYKINKDIYNSNCQNFLVDLIKHKCNL